MDVQISTIIAAATSAYSVVTSLLLARKAHMAETIKQLESNVAAHKDARAEAERERDRAIRDREDALKEKETEAQLLTHLRHEHELLKRDFAFASAVTLQDRKTIQEMNETVERLSRKLDFLEREKP